MQQFPTLFPTLLNALDHNAKERPNAIVLRRLGFREKPHDELGFADLQQAAQRFARTLCTLTKPHDRVLLAYPSSNAFVIAFLGCLYAGRIAVPVSLGSNVRNGERIAAIGKDCDARLLVSPSLNSVGLTCAVPEGCLAVEHATLAEGDDDATLPSVAPSDICFLQYTSGSTGQPKGVIVSHENLTVNLTQIQNAIGHTHSRIVSWLPQFHDMGLIGTMLLPIFAGIQTTYMSPLEFVQRPIRWLQALSEYRAHGSVAPNFGFSYVLDRLRPGDLEGLDLSCVTTLMCGSEPINADVLDRFVKSLAVCGLAETAPMPTYGLAEATLMVSAHPRSSRIRTLRPELDGPIACKGTTELVACGYPATGLDLRILDEQGRDCPEGVEGEITVGGANVCVGYWGKTPHTGLARTGDLGFLWDGELFVTGRKKDLIILRGRNLYPTDIETLSESCTPRAGANSCAAIGLTSTDGTESLVVAQEIPAASMRDLDPDALRTDIAGRILDHVGIVPAQVLLLRSNTLPRTTSGKISRFGLKAALGRGEIDEAFSTHAIQTGILHA
ncbi:MAG: fatty acyl-AMP ligase [Cognatishimia sp.]|uniref:fatty acyl-AMP ligase n=1 Tax=Cognatishimia sp. TaxID=2211648 RepID=UPI003B8E4649